MNRFGKHVMPQNPPFSSLRRGCALIFYKFWVFALLLTLFESHEGALVFQDSVVFAKLLDTVDLTFKQLLFVRA